MTVKQLIELLETFPQDSLVIADRELDFQPVKKVVSGIYTETDYGNDFYPFDEFLVQEELEKFAVCLYFD